MAHKFYAVGWISIGNKMYPAPTDEDSTFVIFYNKQTAIRFAEDHGGCKICPVEITMKFPRRKSKAK